MPKPARVCQALLVAALASPCLGTAAPAPIFELPLELVPAVELAKPVTVELWTRNLAGAEAVAAGRGEVPGGLRLAVPKGQWIEAWATAEGWWSTRVFAFGGADGEAEALVLHPTGVLAGKLLVPAGQTMPAALRLRFETAAGRKAEHPVPQSELACPVADGAFACPLPAAALDVRLGGEGWVPKYLWGLELAAGKRHELGELALVRGASISGFVRDAASDREVAGAAVRLATAQVGNPPDAAAGERLARLELAATTDARGFFQLTGVPAGQYQLQASLGEARSEELTQGIFEDREIALLAPLMIAPPGAVEVVVAPPLAPDGRGWTLQMARLGAKGPFPQLVSFKEVEAGAGLFRATKVAYGEYFLKLSDHSGATWAGRPLKVGGGTTRLIFDLELVAIEGRVTLNGEPLAATLVFGGERGLRRIALASDEKGQYRGLLPEAGPWPVDLQANEPKLGRRWRAKQVPAPENGVATLDFEISDLAIAGRMVDAEGNGILGSILFITPGEGLEQLRTGTDGGFEKRGLDPGKYVLHGFTPGLRSQTERVEVAVEAGVETPFVELEIVPGTKLEGVVVSSWGSVPGARVQALPRAGAAFAGTINPTSQTDVAGAFALELPPGTDAVELQVAAPGYGFKALRLDSLAGQAVIRVLREAGTIVVEGAGGRGIAELDETHQLFHDGVDVPFPTLAGWASLYGEETGSPTELAIPMMDLGDYDLCPRGAPITACQRDFLRPYGEIRFTVGEKAAGEDGGEGDDGGEGEKKP